MSSQQRASLRRSSSRKRPARDPHLVITERILEQLSQGVVPWRQPWASSGGLPANHATGKRYRGVNVVSLLLAGYGDPRWVTFKQAEALGGRVRVGERGAPIVRWLETQRRLSAEEARQAIGRGERVGTDEQGCFVVRMGMRLFWGFNLLQVEGIERPDVPRVTWDRDERAETVLRAFSGGPRVVEGGDAAQYRGGPDVVYVPDRGRFAEGGAYYHAAFHELVRATGHASRLARDLTGAFASTVYAREELVAEIGAAMLCAHCGLDVPPESSASYIAGWLAVLEGDSRLVVSAAQAAQRAVDLVLGERAA